MGLFDFFKKKYLLRDIHMYIRPGRMVLLLGGKTQKTGACQQHFFLDLHKIPP